MSWTYETVSTTFTDTEHKISDVMVNIFKDNVFKYQRIIHTHNYSEEEIARIFCGIRDLHDSGKIDDFGVSTAPVEEII